MDLPFSASSFYFLLLLLLLADSTSLSCFQPSCLSALTHQAGACL
jgi:hypothetical protein